MQQISSNVHIETRQKGANHGLVATSDGLVLIDTPHKPSDAVRLRSEIERRGKLRYIINTEPHGDHWTGNGFFDVPVIAHEGVRTRMLAANMTEHLARVASFGPEEPQAVGKLSGQCAGDDLRKRNEIARRQSTFRMVAMPGHTPYQAAVIVEEEGVVFTSDNIFCKVQTWIQEGQPDDWLKSLDALGALREDTFVPGHGPVCDKNYLKEQSAFLEEWVAYVRGAVGRGMTKPECIANLTALTDRYPMDVEQDGMAPE